MALVSLPGLILHPPVRHDQMGDSEGIGQTACALNATADKLVFLFLTAPLQSDGTSQETIDSVEFMLGTVTTGDDLKIQIQGVNASGTNDGVLNGTAKVLTVTTGMSNTWASSGTGMGALLAAGVAFSVVITFNSFVAGNMNVMLTQQPSGAGGSYLHSVAAQRNGTDYSGALPNVALKRSNGTLIYILGSSTLLNNQDAPAYFNGRHDPFLFNAPTEAAGPNTLTTSGIVMTSTSHGLSTSRGPCVRIVGNTEGMAGLNRLALQSVDANTADLDAAFPVNISSATAWTRHSHIGEIALKFSVPFRCRVSGAWFVIYNLNGATFDVILYGTDAQTALASVSLVDGKMRSDRGIPTYAYFSAVAVLVPGSTYYLAVKSTGTNAVGIVAVGVNAAADLSAYELGANGLLSTRMWIPETATITTMTAGAITLSASLTGTKQVIYNSTNPQYSDWVAFTSGANNGKIAQIIAFTDQQHFSVTSTGLTDIVAGTVSWERASCWADRTRSVPQMGLLIDQIDDGAGMRPELRGATL